MSITLRRRAVVGLTATAAAAALALAGCSSTGSDSSKVTITLEGPNQWNAETRTFGSAWDKLVSSFEKENPNITVKTTVLPLSSWATTSAAQLTAGTAPELIFNQTAHKQGQILDLTPYLKAKNPYATTATWLDEYDPKVFGDSAKNASGQFEYVPFNLVSVGIFYNKDVLDKAGVDISQLATFDGFTKACTKLRSQGINPLATDSGNHGYVWPTTALESMLMQDLAAKVDVFDALGNPGKATPVTAKSWAKALLDGSLDLTKSPEAADLAKLLKQWYDACATPNWSGIPSQGTFTGGTAFTSGKAAMAWGTTFSSASLDGVGFPWGAVTFPSISTSDSSYANGKPAQYGVGLGGTSYMIPAYVKGAKRDAAVRFLEYVSSPKASTWLKETGALSPVKDQPQPKQIASLQTPDWSTPSVPGVGPFNAPAADAGKNGVDGYLLGAKTLDKYLAEAQQNAVAWAKEQAADNGWTDLG